MSVRPLKILAMPRVALASEHRSGRSTCREVEAMLPHVAQDPLGIFWALERLKAQTDQTLGRVSRPSLFDPRYEPSPEPER